MDEDDYNDLEETIFDVLDYNNNYICSIGQNGMMDFPHYAKNCSLDYALERRRLYLNRHKNESDRIGSPNYYTRRILW
jgi:hypothetical protein